MSNAATGGYVVPNPRIPKILGILNIVFASGIMLYGLCMLGSIVMMPALSKSMETMQKKMDDVVESQKQAELKQLDEREKAAKTDAEKEKIEDERAAVLARPKAPMNPGMNLNALGYSDPRVQSYMWADVFTSILLNGMMLAAGIGLVTRKGWSIRLGLWTAGLKIVRLIAIYSYAALVVVPVIALGLGKFAMQQMTMTQQTMGKPLPPGFDTGMFVRIYTITYTVMAVGMVVVGSIYPIVSLWLLSRPGARAACSGLKSPDEGTESW